MSKTVLCNVILLQVIHTHFSKGTCKIIQNINLDSSNKLKNSFSCERYTTFLHDSLEELELNTAIL